MKKFLLFLVVIFLAYITAFYTAGKKNAYEDPFDFSQLEQKLNGLFDIEPDKIEIGDDYLQNGINYLEEGYYEDALGQFFEALYENENSEINYYIGHTYLLTEEYMKAVSYLSTSINLDPENAKAYRDRGIAKYNQSYYDEAIKDLYFSTEFAPEDPLTYYNIAMSYEAQEKYEVALQSAETALKYDSTNIDYWFKAGDLAFDTENYKLACLYYKSLLTIDPIYKYALLNLGLSYDNLDEKDSAIYYYDKVLNLFPDYALAYNNKAYVFKKTGEYKEAMNLYNKAIELDPKMINAFWNRGDINFQLKNYKEAIEDYRRVYALNTEYYNTLYHIGECYELMDNSEQALIYYRKYKELASSDSKYFNEVEIKIKKMM